MKHREIISAIEWAKRVNGSWLVRSNLKEHAAEWIDYLAALADGRLEKSCLLARQFCDLRRPDDDPKPWFYAGLFRLATAAEAGQFLSTHRVTKATVPSMLEDPDVQLWLDRVGPETHELMARLRSAR